MWIQAKIFIDFTVARTTFHRLLGCNKSLHFLLDFPMTSFFVSIYNPYNCVHACVCVSVTYCVTKKCFLRFLLQTRLDGYRDLEKKGEKLTTDQKHACKKYEEVIHSLDLAKELNKQFAQLVKEANREAKRENKRVSNNFVNRE